MHRLSLHVNYETMQILKIWNRFSKVPGGRFLFSKFLGAKIPYSGSVSPEIMALTPGHAQVKIRDKRAHRNHLESIHAVALMNVGEMATGLAISTAVPENTRVILKSFKIDFIKKARGDLVAHANHELVPTNEKKEFEVTALVKDAGGETVCQVKALWLVGPNQR